MTNWLLKKDYTIFIYAKEDVASYDAAIKALGAANAAVKVYDRWTHRGVAEVTHWMPLPALPEE